MRGRKRKFPANYEPAPWLSSDDEGGPPNLPANQGPVAESNDEGGPPNLPANQGPVAEVQLQSPSQDDEDDDDNDPVRDLLEDIAVDVNDAQHDEGEHSDSDVVMEEEEEVHLQANQHGMFFYIS